MRAKRCLKWDIAILPSWFTRLTRENEQVMAPDDQQDAVLQAYFEMMSELFLKQELGDVEPGDDARHTATVLRSVDVARRATLIRFLSQSGLVLLGIGTDLQTLNLSGADLGHLALGKVRLLESCVPWCSRSERGRFERCQCHARAGASGKTKQAWVT